MAQQAEFKIRYGSILVDGVRKSSGFEFIADKHETMKRYGYQVIFMRDVEPDTSEAPEAVSSVAKLKRMNMNALHELAREVGLAEFEDLKKDDLIDRITAEQEAIAAAETEAA